LTSAVALNFHLIFTFNGLYRLQEYTAETRKIKQIHHTVEHPALKKKPFDTKTVL